MTSNARSPGNCQPPRKLRKSWVAVFGESSLRWSIGEVPATSDADITVQTREVLASIERQLTKLGSNPARILMATIYLTDLADCAAMNAVWDAWIPPGSAPARACVKVAGLVDPGWRIEIALSAAR